MRLSRRRRCCRGQTDISVKLDWRHSTTSDGGTGNASGSVTARQTHRSFELGEEQIGRA